MNSEELEKWVTEDFWPTYLLLVKTPFKTRWGAGSRGECIALMVRKKPPTDLREKVLAALFAQIRHRKALYELCGSERAYELRTKRHDGSLYLNRHGKTWFNNYGWTDPIPSISEERASPKIEGVCACGEPVVVLALNVCERCWTDKYTDSKRKLYDNLVRRGMGKKEGETDEAYRERCRIELTGGADVNRFSVLQAYKSFTGKQD